MDVDLKMLLQIGSVLVAIVGAMAVARQQLKSLSEDFEMFRDAVNKKTGDLSNSLDKTENLVKILGQKFYLPMRKKRNDTKKHWIGKNVYQLGE